MEVPAEQAGTVEDILVKAEQIVKQGDAIMALNNAVITETIDVEKKRPALKHEVKHDEENPT